MSEVKLDGFGEHVFRGDIAKPFLEKQGLAAEILEGYSWCFDGNADKVISCLLSLFLCNTAQQFTVI
jgi:hypothetical protein